MAGQRTFCLREGFITLGFAALCVAGCSADRVQEKLQPTERALQPAVSAMECGGGSVSAAISACRAAGGHTGHCAIVAANAGMSGATACYTYAAQVKRRRAQLVGQEDQLDAHIRYLQEVNQDTEGLNTELSVKIIDVTARTDTAVDSLARGEMTQIELAQLHAILDHEVTAAQHQRDLVSRELQAARQYRSRQPVEVAPELDAEIARLQELLDQAQRDTAALIVQRERI